MSFLQNTTTSGIQFSTILCIFNFFFLRLTSLNFVFCQMNNKCTQGYQKFHTRSSTMQITALVNPAYFTFHPFTIATDLCRQEYYNLVFLRFEKNLFSQNHRSEGSLEIIWSSSPAQNRVNESKLLRFLSSQVLSIFRNRDSTSPLGNLFLCSITLTVKKFLQSGIYIHQ